VRWRSVVPLTIASAVTVAAVATVVVRHEQGHPSATPSPTATPTLAPARPPVLTALPAAALPLQSEVTAIVDAAAAKVPSDERLAGTVIDVSTGAALWSHHPHAQMAPASTTKLLTAAAALQTLGPDYRLTTSTRQQGDVVYLVGGGDPTLIRTPTSTVIPAYPQPASLSDLAMKTAAGLAPGVPIRLRVDTSAWTGPTSAHGWESNYVAEGDVTPPSPLELDGGRLHPADFDSERTPTPAAQAADAFMSLLRADGVTVKGTVEDKTAPQTSTTLASVSSPPLSALVQRMLTESDNDLAEALGRAVAASAGLPTSFTGAASAVLAEVAKLGVPTSTITLYDTSGLSHDDRVDPDALVALLRAAASPTLPALRPILEGLPVAGFTGTLADRYQSHSERAGAGFVRAKTGTLTGVDALAGLVVDRSGRLLAFALMASGSDSETAVEAGLDRIASSLATVD
jgi:D-alanyl-D-alanine carboxypeptidase/D-alanyl-D-alanine-endopeptidase (penicillin-binding protein 4)